MVAIVRLLYTIPILIASGGMSSSTDLIWPSIISGETSRIEDTLRVFCAVMAVIAVQP
jgi:hypothetical protein